jgi:hypothetical protein
VKIAGTEKTKAQLSDEVCSALDQHAQYPEELDQKLLRRLGEALGNLPATT